MSRENRRQNIQNIFAQFNKTQGLLKFAYLDIGRVMNQGKFVLIFWIVSVCALRLLLTLKLQSTGHYRVNHYVKT